MKVGQIVRYVGDRFEALAGMEGELMGETGASLTVWFPPFASGDLWVLFPAEVKPLRGGYTKAFAARFQVPREAPRERSGQWLPKEHWRDQGKKRLDIWLDPPAAEALEIVKASIGQRATYREAVEMSLISEASRQQKKIDK